MQDFSADNMQNADLQPFALNQSQVLHDTITELVAEYTTMDVSNAIFAGFFALSISWPIRLANISP